MSIEAKKKPIPEGLVEVARHSASGRLSSSLGRSALSPRGSKSARNYVPVASSKDLCVKAELTNGIECLVVSHADDVLSVGGYAFNYTPMNVATHVKPHEAATPNRLSDVKKLPGFGIWADKNKDALEIESELRGEWA